MEIISTFLIFSFISCFRLYERIEWEKLVHEAIIMEKAIANVLTFLLINGKFEVDEKAVFYCMTVRRSH